VQSTRQGWDPWGRVRRAGGAVACCGWRCVAIAGVVGTILTAINQGDVIVAGDAATSLAWKIPLNYLTPFVVSTLGYRAAVRGR